MARVLQPEVHCSSAREFLDKLSPLGEYFGKTKPNEPWLFRGQGSDLPLIPSSFRNDSRRFASLTNRNIQDNGERSKAERDILVQFFEIADRRGLVLPDDSQQLRSTLETLKSERGDDNVPRGDDEWQMHENALSLMALAQHYGVPTPLLDWTRQPFIAAFFAAEGAMNQSERYHGSKTHENDEKSSLVVWAFYFPLLGKHDVIDRLNSPVVRVVTAPSATNPNLKAQQAVFTLLGRRYTALPMDQVLEDEARKILKTDDHRPNSILGCELRKFTLPTSEAFDLLYLLAKLDITPSAIYPGYHSIVRDLELIQLHFQSPKESE